MQDHTVLDWSEYKGQNKIYLQDGSAIIIENDQKAEDLVYRILKESGSIPY